MGRGKKRQAELDVQHHEEEDVSGSEGEEVRLGQSECDQSFCSSCSLL